MRAYHGLTLGAMSATGLPAFWPMFEPRVPGFVHIDAPDPYRFVSPDPSVSLGVAAANQLEAAILREGPDTVAAFIAEPVQGAGGVIIPPETYWPAVQAICDKYGILLVSDEVICGFGRTGRWFGCETMGTRPDLMTFAKGVTSGYVPLGGVMVGERVARVLIDKGGEFNHGYTYSGHPVACAVALANIRLIRREGLVDRVREDTGPYLAEQYAALKDHPLVGDAETCGLMGAILLVQDKERGTPFASELEVGMVCRGHCFANGLIMRAVGDRMIVAPPLVITRAQIDEMMALIRRCLDLTWKDVKTQGWA